MNVSVFGFSTEPSIAGDFTPIVKYDARAGRIFRIDRENNGNGFENNPVDITQTFRAVVDFENLETGWMDFAAGSAPSFALVPIGTKLPDRPSERHKNGIRFSMKLNKACGGDKPVREIAGTSKAFLAGVEEVYQEYEKQKRKNPGKLPVLTLKSTTPIKSGSGEKTSTNYRPKFVIDGWAARPAELVYVPVENTNPAPVAPLAPVAPSTGSTIVPPPGAVVPDDDEFF